MLMRKVQENRTRVCDPSFFKNKELFLECASVPLPGVVDRSEVTPLQLDIVIYVSMETCLYHVVACHSTHVTPLNPQAYRLSDTLNKHLQMFERSDWEVRCMSK